MDINVADNTVDMASAPPAIAVPPTASQASPSNGAGNALDSPVAGAGVVSAAPAPAVRRVYDDVDLGEYDEAYKGQALRVLQNPTRGMRRDFMRASVDPASGAWLEHMALILDCQDVAQVVDGMDIEILNWLFIPRVEAGKLILPAIYDVWDRYVDQRVKARAAR